MIQARIYKPAKTAMQSGKAKSRQWILEYVSTGNSFIDPIMGWYGSNDTLHQVRLTFPSLNAAMNFAQERNLSVQVESAHIPNMHSKSYADNFRHDRAM